MSIDDLIKNEHQRKERFVEQLGELFSRFRISNIVGMEYQCDRKTNEETVIILYSIGDDQKVCVTADSLTAIVKDIFRRIT